MDMRNTMILTGNLGQDPKVKNLEIAGKPKVVTEGSIAYTPRGKEEPCWYNFEIWGETPAKLVGGLKKGDKLQINGPMTYDTGEDGTKYYKIVADGFELMSTKSEAANTKKKAA